MSASATGVQGQPGLSETLFLKTTKGLQAGWAELWLKSTAELLWGYRDPVTKKTNRRKHNKGGGEKISKGKKTSVLILVRNLTNLVWASLVQ